MAPVTREQIARLIEPHGWGVFDIHGDAHGGRSAISDKDRSLVTADAILTALPGQSVHATCAAALAVAADRIEELEEIISDLVNNHEELSVMGTWPGRAEVFRKAWDRAAEAVGLDDGADA